MFKIFKKLKSGPNHKRGFTILESIVALAILSLVIAGVFSSIRTSLTLSINAKEEIRAFYMAQEAIEILRHIRDENRLQSLRGISTAWDAGISNLATDPCYNNKKCFVDATKTGGSFLYECPFGVCSNIRQNPSTFVYGYDGSWLLTKYKREIEVQKNTADEAIVVITISWSKGANNYSFKVKTLLFNWS